MEPKPIRMRGWSAPMGLALRLLARDWRAGELRVLLLALVLSAASVSCVGFVADRISRAIHRDALQVLGGDLLLVADAPWPDTVLAEARARGLRTAGSTTLVSMARAADAVQLAALKAVGPSYPLRGSLRIADGPGLPDRAVEGGPAEGTVWVEDRLLGALGIRVGERVGLGAVELRVAAVLTAEPDRGIAFFNVAPRILMTEADLARSALIQPQSRASWQVSVAGEAAAVPGFERWLRGRLARGQSIRTLDNARPEVRNTLARSEQFLGMAGLLTVVLCGVALILAARRYARRQEAAFALMRCLGAPARRLLWLSALQLALLGLCGAALGCVLAWAVQALAAEPLAASVGTTLPSPGWQPLADAFGLALAMLAGGAFAPLARLRRVPALRVLRRDPLPGAARAQRVAAAAAALPALAVLAGLALWQARDLALAGYLLGGLALGGLLVLIIGAVALALAALAGARGPLAWRSGIRHLCRHRGTALVQLGCLSVAISVLLLLAFTGKDLIDGWQTRIPPQAPNHFLINIQPEQREGVLALLAAAGLPAPALYPVVRARLVAVNGQPVDVNAAPDERVRRLLDREFNLSYATVPPPGNRVIGGRWFDAPMLAEGGISLEEGIAQSLGLHLGDRLTWAGADRRFSAPVTSIRRLDWDSMQVNFFVVATPGLLADQATSYITSFYLPPQREDLVGALVRSYPNLSLIDTGAILRQVLGMVGQVIRALELLFLFTLAAGVLVLQAALLSTRDERLQESALMRALGARRVQVAGAHWVEFGLLGVLAGAAASVLAAATGELLARRVFAIPYAPGAALWAAGPLVGLACAAWNARAAARLALERPPAVALREAD
jgi:putative ABC transport system permease protein